MARPFACAMAHFTISRGDLFRNSALALEIWSGVIFSNKGTKPQSDFVPVFVV
jgi:hypothetical protein